MLFSDVKLSAMLILSLLTWSAASGCCSKALLYMLSSIVGIESRGGAEGSFLSFSLSPAWSHSHCAKAEDPSSSIFCRPSLVMISPLPTLTTITEGIPKKKWSRALGYCNLNLMNVLRYIESKKYYLGFILCTMRSSRRKKISEKPFCKGQFLEL